MPHLIAQGADRRHRWKRRVPEDHAFSVGRDAGVWSAPWDTHISRRHVECSWDGAVLHVTVVPESRNPVFWRGVRANAFEVAPGEHFVIGDTVFSLVEQDVRVGTDVRALADEQTFSGEYLRQWRYRDANQRIDVLNRLPDLVAGAASDEELCAHLSSVLFAGIRQASSVAVVVQERAGSLRVLHWDRRSTGQGEFEPSARLIRSAIEQSKSVAHVWCDEGASIDSGFTQRGQAEWAFCTPLLSKSSFGWCLYVTGGESTPIDTESSPSTSVHDLRDEIKFAELVSSTVARLRELRVLEQGRAGLRPFFSPPVVAALEEKDHEQVLAPRETDVVVLFCDLRGFSRTAEQSSDNLMGLLQRVSDALGVLTRNILREGGVVGDFQGDAAMGFWGWPIAQPDRVRRACRAALSIRSEFAAASRDSAHPLHNFRVGIGIASGRAVAGKIGTHDQVKVTVFGPVVNLAARLEGMTKILRAPILIDHNTLQFVHQEIPATEARVRRLAVVRPYGMDRAIEIGELLPPFEQFPQLSDEHLRLYEQALDAFLAKDWEQAYELMHRVPADDRVKDFLTVFIAKYNRTPPTHWDGVIPIDQK
ncbi:MAG: adenylate/guanylate cyclase domain-containing protein [Planctomycetota bacterium]|nr:adenylate/guanylate cyclase domain-containing protein [Planctomycetota bacterium]